MLLRWRQEVCPYLHSESSCSSRTLQRISQSPSSLLQTKAWDPQLKAVATMHHPRITPHQSFLTSQNLPERRSRFQPALSLILSQVVFGLSFPLYQWHLSCLGFFASISSCCKTWSYPLYQFAAPSLYVVLHLPLLRPQYRRTCGHFLGRVFYCYFYWLGPLHHRSPQIHHLELQAPH